ncbi:MAG: HAD family hydrolase [Syntrophobacteraceae bacterium]|nr:HAD family hydrolase [Syntrophobacteraceae bacterium]
MHAKDYKAVLFDIDGTLLDTLGDIADAMNSALERLRYPPHALDSYRHMVGEGMENLARRALPDRARSDPKQVLECLEIMLKTYDCNWNATSRPYPGISELLDTLTARGLKMAVLSNKPHEFAVKVVKEFLSAWRFEVVLGERPMVPRKPDPFSALEIADRLSIEPANFIYLGDSATDMKTANGAGMFPVGVLWGFRDAGELMAGGAAKLISQPVELLELL